MALINFVNPWPQFFGISDYAGYYIYFGQPNQDPVANPKNVFDLNGVSQGPFVQLNSRGAPLVPLQLIDPPYSMILYTGLAGSGGAAVPNTEVPELNGLDSGDATASDIWESVVDAVKLDNVAKLNPTANNAAIVLNNTQFRVGDETDNEEFFQVEGLDTFVSSSLIRKNRNKLINAQGRFNQRGVSGSVVLLVGEYGHDLWRAGSGGGTYTFATSLGITTFTITAGTMEQVIAGDNLHSGAVILSWEGEAQAQINGGGYGDSPITGTAVGGTNMTIEFQQNGTNDFSLPQLEYGPSASDFEYKLYNDEFDECKRYAEVFVYAISKPVATCLANGAGSIVGVLNYAEKRAIPTITVLAGSFNASLASGVTAGGTESFSFISETSCQLNITGGAGMTTGNASNFLASGSGATLLIDAGI